MIKGAATVSSEILHHDVVGIFHQFCFISAITVLSSVPRLHLSVCAKYKVKMLPEMESTFSFKTANLGSWKKALVQRLNKRVRDSLSKDPVLRTQVDS